MSRWPDTRQSLIRRLADRSDADAWAFFEDHYQQPIYRFARSRNLHPDEALDVIQEVFMAVHRAAAEWESSGRVGSFRAWLAEACRRITLQVTRQHARVGRGVGGSDVHESLASAAQLQLQQEEADEQRWAFYCAAADVQREVNPQHWLAFWMTAIDGKSANEVAEALQMKPGNVYSAKCRILAKLKSNIESLQKLEASSQGSVS